MIKMLSVALFALALVGCSSDGGVKEGAPQTVNAMCPGMGKPVTAEAGTVEWNGMTVGFCCDGCIGDFEALDDTAKVVALKKVGTEIDG